MGGGRQPRDGPATYHLFDRDTKRAEVLFSDSAALGKATLARMEPVEFPAADGLTVRGYLSTPPGVPAKNLPTVVLVHGGPWGRDVWRFSPVVQWLADRGYAVLQANFRGSTGYGKQFLNAGNREWAGKPVRAEFRRRVGDVDTEAASLDERSPLNKADRIVRPLLIGQGANDPRVKQAESDQIVAALRKAGKPVGYVVYPDEGHGFQRPANRLHFFAVAEQFLAKHAGGRAEPVGDVPGHTGQMK